MTRSIRLDKFGIYEFFSGYYPSVLQMAIFMLKADIGICKDRDEVLILIGYLCVTPGFLVVDYMQHRSMHG